MIALMPPMTVLDHVGATNAFLLSKVESTQQRTLAARRYLPKRAGISHTRHVCPDPFADVGDNFGVWALLSPVGDLPFKGVFSLCAVEVITSVISEASSRCQFAPLVLQTRRLPVNAYLFGGLFRCLQYT